MDNIMKCHLTDYLLLISNVFHKKLTVDEFTLM